MSRRSSRDGAGAKQPTDYEDIAEAGGLATSNKIPLIDVELDCMTAALARVFKAPGAAGDSGANLFYVFNGALHPFCGVFEPNANGGQGARGAHTRATAVAVIVAGALVLSTTFG